MVIAIPYTHEPHNGIELLYALRSIEKHLPGSEVVVIGEAPNWYKGESINQKDFTGRKQYSIYQKLLKIAEQTDEFIYWNDDHFLLKPTEIKDWHFGLLKEELKNNTTSGYKSVVKKTLDLLPDALNFDIHIPIKIDSKKFRNLFQSREDEICIKSFYANQVECEPEEMSDLKINGWFSKDQIISKLKGRTFFSTGTALCDPMVEVLQKLFPFKSKYES